MASGIKKINWFSIAVIGVLIAGILIPLPAGVVGVLKVVGKYAVVVLFLVYGARLSTKEVWNGLKNLRLQGSIFSATYVVFPLLGIANYYLFGRWLGAFAAGILYLSLLPSTVQSSIAFTSIAKGNVAGAVCAATISNLIGVIGTPLWVALAMSTSVTINLTTIRDVVLLLILPFAIGQIAQPWVGDFLRARRYITKTVDNGTVLLVVAAGTTEATLLGLWEGISWPALIVLLVDSGVLLTLMLLGTWFGGKALGLNREDRIALLMCGSKKSMATGLPMANIIFPGPQAATLIIPVIVFHQLQLLVCALLARRLGESSPTT